MTLFQQMALLFSHHVFLSSWVATRESKHRTVARHLLPKNYYNMDSDQEQEDIKFNMGDEEEEEEDTGDEWNEDDEETGGDGEENEPKAETQIPAENLLSRIKNKLRRREMFENMESDKRANLKKRKKEGKCDERVRETRTIDNSSGFRETIPEPESETPDPFSCYFSREKEPKLLMTTVDHPRVKTIRFCREFARTIPNTEFKFRKNCSIKGTAKAAYERGYTHLLIVNQDRRVPNGILMTHLPDGPTANFKLSSIRYHKDIKRHGAISIERPEIIVNNFHTRLGQTIGRFFVSLCHFEPEFKGRRVVTFHNQRDYIFFRHHRYQFKNKEKVALQEIGPRFTLRLRWFQKGPFNTKNGQFDWVSKREEKEQSTGKRLFFL